MSKEMLNIVMMNERNPIVDKIITTLTNTTGILIPQTNKISDSWFRRLVTQMQGTEPTIYYEKNNYSEVILNFYSKSGGDIPMHLSISIWELRHKPIELDKAIFKKGAFMYWINGEHSYIMFELKPCTYAYRDRFTETGNIEFMAELVRDIYKNYNDRSDCKK